MNWNWLFEEESRHEMEIFNEEITGIMQGARGNSERSNSLFKKRWEARIYNMKYSSTRKYDANYEYLR